jgi:hypothetical protein
MFGDQVFLGIVLDIQPMKDVYKDSHRGEIHAGTGHVNLKERLRKSWKGTDPC